MKKSIITFVLAILAIGLVHAQSTDTGLVKFSYSGSRLYIPNVCPDAPYAILPIEVSGYPANAVITDISQIASMCINLEHSFSSDLTIQLQCPNGSKYTISNGTNHSDSSKTAGGSFLGLPLGLNNHALYDSGTQRCDSTLNQPGTGWTYCFSRRSDYTLYSGIPADSDIDTAHHNNVFWQVPTIAHTEDSDVTTTNDSANYLNKSNYIQFPSGYDTLLGCPVNGTWQLLVSDWWAVDNGWVFWWDMDFDLDGTPTESINSVESNKYRIFPNPAENILIVEGDNISHISIYNMAGMRLTDTSKRQIDLSDLSAGTYILKVFSHDGNTYTYKVMHL